MLTLKDVSVDIAGIPVLRRLSVDIKPGVTYAIVGRNGAGKTTLLRTIMGLCPVRAGTISMTDQDLLALPSFERAALGIGYAPEDRVLFPTMTVLENLHLPCEAIGLTAAETRERVRSAVAVVPLIEPMLGRSAAALSGGQGKMVALARALMTGTRLLLLDEPFQGLAPALARQCAVALSQLHPLRPELCVVIAESNQALLTQVPSTVMTLERGELKRS